MSVCVSSSSGKPTTLPSFPPSLLTDGRDSPGLRADDVGLVALACMDGVIEEELRHLGREGGREG